MNDPSSHSYLGNDLEYCHNRHILLENEVVEALLILIPGIVLLPNETLPLRLQAGSVLADSIRMVLLTSMSRDLIIGVVNESVFQRRIPSKVIGTVADIRQRSRIREDSLEDDDLIFILKGSYRFSIMSVRRSDRNLFASITVLPDDNYKFNPHGWLPWNIKFYPKKHSNLGYGQRFPQWVYNNQSPRNLAEVAMDLVSTHIPSNREWNENKSVLDDPLAYSYHLASNLPISTPMKQVMLEVEDVVMRLKLIIDYLRKIGRKKLCCSQCNRSIAQRSDLFKVPGAGGMIGAYVNSHGAIHETVTVRRILPNAQILLQGRPSSQDSWFPGFEWTIAMCRQCYNHLGWMFTVPQRSDASVSQWWSHSNYAIYPYNGASAISATGNSSSSSLTQFWGFRRGALTDESIEDEDETYSGGNEDDQSVQPSDEDEDISTVSDAMSEDSFSTASQSLSDEHPD